jgi:hypothetical protein
VTLFSIQTYSFCLHGTCWIVNEQQRSVTEFFKKFVQSNLCKQLSSLISGLNVITSFMQHFIQIYIMPGSFIIFILMIPTPFHEVLMLVSVMFSLFISLKPKHFSQHYPPFPLSGIKTQFLLYPKHLKKKNTMALVRQRTIPPARPPLSAK